LVVVKKLVTHKIGDSEGRRCGALHFGAEDVSDHQQWLPRLCSNLQLPPWIVVLFVWSFHTSSPKVLSFHRSNIFYILDQLFQYLLLLDHCFNIFLLDHCFNIYCFGPIVPIMTLQKILQPLSDFYPVEHFLWILWFQKVATFCVEIFKAKGLSWT